MMKEERFHREVPRFNRGLTPKERHGYEEIQKSKIWKVVAEAYSDDLTQDFINTIEKTGEGERTMNNEEKIQKVKELAEKLEWRKNRSVPMKLEEIQEMEGRLGVKLPEEYREFLKIFGCIDLFGVDILGQGRSVEYSALETTLKWRGKIMLTKISRKSCSC